MTWIGRRKIRIVGVVMGRNGVIYQQVNWQTFLSEAGEYITSRNPQTQRVES